jgi:plastocyanin
MRLERVGSAVIAVAFGLAAMVGGPSVVEANGFGLPEAQKRFFTIAAVEPKGGTTADKEPFPTQPLPAGPGYVLKQPDQTGRWEISAYVWQPTQIFVNEGDEVTLEFIGINGASHPTTIAGYGKTFALKRGHVQRVTFVADKPGVFPIVCATHQPSMRAELVVMARQ